MSSAALKAWEAIAPEIGWDQEDPEGPGIGAKALETLTVNEFAEMNFSVRIDEPVEKVRSLVKCLVDGEVQGHPFSFLVLQGKEAGEATLWCSLAGYRHLLKNWTDDARALSRQVKN